MKRDLGKFLRQVMHGWAAFHSRIYISSITKLLIYNDIVETIKVKTIDFIEVAVENLGYRKWCYKHQPHLFPCSFKPNSCLYQIQTLWLFGFGGNSAIQGILCGYLSYFIFCDSNLIMICFCWNATHFKTEATAAWLHHSISIINIEGRRVCIVGQDSGKIEIKSIKVWSKFLWQIVGSVN